MCNVIFIILNIVIVLVEKQILKIINIEKNCFAAALNRAKVTLHGCLYLTERNLQCGSVWGKTIISYLYENTICHLFIHWFPQARAINCVLSYFTSFFLRDSYTRHYHTTTMMLIVSVDAHRSVSTENTDLPLNDARLHK